MVLNTKTRGITTPSMAPAFLPSAPLSGAFAGPDAMAITDGGAVARRVREFGGYRLAGQGGG